MRIEKSESPTLCDSDRRLVDNIMKDNIISCSDLRDREKVQTLRTGVHYGKNFKK